MRIVVTGATGLIGTALCETLAALHHEVIAVARTLNRSAPVRAGVRQITHDFRSGPPPDVLFDGTGALVHLAGFAHQRRYSDETLRRINIDATAELARCAATTGTRFVYLSSVKVHGDATTGNPFDAGSPFNPCNAYARSKVAAEEAIRSMAYLQWVVLRPPLVYGPGVKANFLSLMRAVDRGIPLPLGGIDNRRSLIYVRNLVDAILTCVEHPAAVGQTYLVSDGEDLSTRELVRRIAGALGSRLRLWALPPAILRLAGIFTGRSDAIARLTGSLTVDSGAIRESLGWRPPFTVQQGLEETARWFRIAK